MYCYNRTPTEVLPIGDAAKPHSFATRFSEFVVSLPHPFSIVTTASQLFSEHLSSAQFLQLISTALKVVPSLPSSAQLFSPLPCSSQLPPTILTCAHLVFTLLNSSKLVSTRLQLFPPLLQLFPPLLTSAQLISPLSQLISTLLTFSILASSSQLFSPLVTKMLTQRASFYTPQAFTHRSFYTEKLLHTASFYTEKLLHTEAFTQRSFTYTQRTFTQSKKLCTQRSFYTEQALSQRSFYTQKLLHTEAFTHRSFYTPSLLHTQKLLHTKTFYTPKLLHREALTQRSFYTQKCHNRKAPAPKWRKVAATSPWEPWCSHSNAIYDRQLQKTIVLRTQAKQRGTLTQPLQCDLQNLWCKTQWNYAQRHQKLQLQNRIWTPEPKKVDFEALFKRNFKRKIIGAKIEKICCQSTIHTSHAAITMRLTTLSCKTQ